ncbi:uncharacterized protein LOC129749791 [Uranotaenia lowii]|uniref:uncharacterized protein LOC129749791 n=1 Tax=Uranotaenia lowii TaxID=190385 RepID=UPI00247A14FD|nr:uncharacterized protein LOC129749791 [Uranotaenia lowii]
MDFDDLPIEIVQEILSYLPLKGLLGASLVCRKWLYYSEPLVIRKCCFRIALSAVEHIDMLNKLLRSYQNIEIRNVEYWNELSRLMLILPKKLSPRMLVLRNISMVNLERFYQCFPPWFDSLESIFVCLILDASDSDVVESFTMTLPKLQHLEWYERVEFVEPKTVTIHAPCLVSASVEDNFDAAALLRLGTTNNLKRLKCTFWRTFSRNGFVDIFPGSFTSLETLTLDFGFERHDTSFLLDMPNLRWLDLRLGSKTSTSNFLDHIQNCKLLTVLRLRAESTVTYIDLVKLCNDLENLEKIDFVGLGVQVFRRIYAKNLKFLKLEHFSFLDQVDNLTLVAPKLNTLCLPSEVLPKTHIDGNSNCLVKLFVDLGSVHLAVAIQQQLRPFVQQHECIRDVALRNSHFTRSSYLVMPSDEPVPFVERLELRKLGVDLTFFHYLSKWKTLKHLSLIGCTIECRSASEMVHLSQLRSLHVDFVKLLSTDRKTFPLVVDGAEEIICEWIQPVFVFHSRNLKLNCSAMTTIWNDEIGAF